MESSKSMKSKILTSAVNLKVIVTTVSLWRRSMDRTDKEKVRGFEMLLLRLQVHIKYPKCCIVC
jgi:hypothetical protein